MANEVSKPLLERTLLALLVIQIDSMKPEMAADTLIRAGWTNPETAEILGTTTNAIALRRSRMKKAKEAK
jgi:hypothetical protein